MIADESAPAIQDPRSVGIAAIDEQMTGLDQMPAEKGKPAVLSLRGDPQSKIRQRREDHRDVVDALMI